MKNSEIFEHYKELEEENKGLMKSMHERISLFKADMKKFEKDVFYKDYSYHYTINSSEMKDIRDKFFEEAYTKWKEKK